MIRGRSAALALAALALAASASAARAGDNQVFALHAQATVVWQGHDAFRSPYRGASLNLEQSLTGDLSAFVRAGEADGSVEPYEFADIDRTFAFGLSEGGRSWGREDDRAAAAVAVNDISSAHQAYLAAGGNGILVGDGELPHPGPETILEAYYSLTVVKGLHASLDYQFVDNPAYNRDRGPVSILALRLHAQY